VLLQLVLLPHFVVNWLEVAQESSSLLLLRYVYSLLLHLAVPVLSEGLSHSVVTGFGEHGAIREGVLPDNLKVGILLHLVSLA